MRIPQLQLLHFVLITFLAAITPSYTQAKEKNVLLICVDDLKPWLHCYGDPIAQTPHIDRLAAQGVRFDRAYCNQAVCAPSRNSLMLSLRPQSIGIYDLPTNFRKSVPEAVTLGQYFKQHGYHTACLGKIFHVGHGNTDDTVSWSVPSYRPGAPGYALDANKKDSSAKNGAAFESAEVPDNFYGDGMTADEAIKRLQAFATEASQPFLLGVGFSKPHLPFVAPKKYWDLYDPSKLPLAEHQQPPIDAPSYTLTNFAELRNYKGMPDKGSVPEDLQRKLIHGYYAAISYADAQIGRVLDQLDSSGLAENTIVVLWGDHGWHLGDHGQWCKHTNYEQATRIPLLISAPGAAQGQSSSALIETVDIYPTLAALAGLPAPQNLDGQDYSSVVRDPGQSIRDHAIHVYPRTIPEQGPAIGRAIRTARYRLVEWKVPGASPETAEYELYDYETDPLETQNLANRPEQHAALKHLQQLLSQHPEAKPQWKSATGNASQVTSAEAAQRRSAMFDDRDKDRDGFLTYEEFAAPFKDKTEAPPRFKRFDTNGDQKLTRQEFITQGK